MKHSLAIIGVGPRGVYALEHLTDLLLKSPLRAPLDVHLIEPGELGAGAVWRTDQPAFLLMNTISSQVTAFGDDGESGRGPTMYEWLQKEGVNIGPDDYPARADHGRYLMDALRAVIGRNVPHLTVHVHPCRAIDVLHEGGRHRVVLEKEHGSVLVDVVLLATGHSEHASTEHDELADFVKAQNELGFTRTGFLPSVYPVERGIAPLNEMVSLGVLGLGLASLDAIIAATEGKGGVFERGADGELFYRPSGKEPRIYAWSRSGLPLAARGINQKGATGRHTARVFTKARIDEMIARSVEKTGAPQLSFKDDVLPVVIQEMEYVYYSVLRGKDFAEAYLAAAPDDRVRLLADVSGEDRFAWEALTMPLEGKVFKTREEFRTFLLGWMRKDVAEARKGNLLSPYKAACDVLRDLRGNLRRAYEFGGMTADAHRTFDRHFWPTHNRIAVGPPLVRIEQLVALVEAGVLDLFWGENPRIAPCPERGCFKLSSWSFNSPSVYIDVLANGRVAQPNIRTDTSPLLNNLRAGGVIRPYANTSGGETYVPCGIDITPRYNVIGADGVANGGVYALGILTEGTQLYTSVAASPGVGARALLDAQGWARDVRERFHDAEERARAEQNRPTIPCFYAPQTHENGLVQQGAGHHVEGQWASVPLQ
jgi:uncharacterized NAD(P)/FAD-binding protein YdhS